MSPRARWLISRPCDGCGDVLAHTVTDAMAQLAELAEDPTTKLGTVKCTRCGRINWIRAQDYIDAA